MSRDEMFSPDEVVAPGEMVRWGYHFTGDLVRGGIKYEGVPNHRDTRYRIIRYPIIRKPPTYRVRYRLIVERRRARSRSGYSAREPSSFLHEQAAQLRYLPRNVPADC